jgi:multidrug efflux pump subunit AcrA (membrane-fusion protein)
MAQGDPAMARAWTASIKASPLWGGRLLGYVVLGAGGLVVAGAVATLAHDRLFHGVAGTEAAAKAEPSEKGPSAASATTVALPEGKFEAAGVKVERAVVAALPIEVGITGRIEPNFNRRIEVRPRASGVVRAVNVVLGQAVKKGDLLVTLDSADVGTARLNLRARQRELATARTEADWRRTVDSNVALLIEALRKGVSAQDLERRFADKPLGTDRAKLMSAYADFEIASHEEQKQTDLNKRKIVGEHPVFIAKHNREGAQAKFEAELEQIKYDAKQQRRVAEQRLHDAEAGVIDAAERLRILGVAEDVAALLAGAGAAGGPSATAEGEDLTVCPIVAPFEGRIIARSAVPSQRAEPTDVLLVLADLATVWVSADVPESNLATLAKLAPGSSLRLTAQAYPGESFDAKILSVGSEVDQATRTVPLRAEAPNPDGLLKLGMFVRVALAAGTDKPALTVPSGAVVEIDGRPGVFVPGKEPRSFTFHPVATGREADGRTVVTAGLAEGAEVVSAGAFLLKSELILQNETGED